MGGIFTKQAVAFENPFKNYTYTNTPNNPFDANDRTSKSLRVVCISDTHTYHRKMTIPDGDVLVHCGDFSNHRSKDKFTDTKDFNDWLGELPHKHKVVISGNHEVHLSSENVDKIQDLLSNATYLQDSSIVIDGIVFYGSPFQPERGITKRANAFSIGKDKIEKTYSKIPNNVDILMTHCPPLDILDHTHKNVHEGSLELLKEISMKKPKVHIFGHNHDEPGILTSTEKVKDKILFVNAAQLIAKKPVVFDYYI